MKPTLNCSDDSLRLLLREDEDSGEYRDAARHVDSCPHCQQRIGELAAEDDEWYEAHEMLLAGDDSGSGTIDPQTDPKSSHERGRVYWRRSSTSWTESMARQLLSPPSHPEMLGRIGRYEVERLIGTGGMGVVFKAFDSELNRPVAVKLLAPYLAGSGAARKRFAREARAAAAVVHEHVVAIHNVETDGEVPFLVMQYVPGESLQSRLDREGALDVCEILRIGMQTASGLAAAHAQGPVRSVAFSPDGQTIASGSQDRVIHLWNATTGQLQQSLKGDSGAIQTVSFNSDGGTLISLTGDDRWKLSVTQWDLRNGTGTRLADVPFGSRVAVSADGSRIA